MIRRMTELRGGSRIAVVNGVMTVVPKVTKVRGAREVLGNGEWITVLRVGPVIVVDVIGKATMIDAILPGCGGAPGGGRKGEASMIRRGGRVIGGGDGVSIGVVTGGLRVSGHGRLVVRIINYAGTVEELCLSSITSGIVGIGGVRVRVEGVCGKGEIRLGRNDGGRCRGVMVDWSAAETGQGDGGVAWVAEEILLRREDVVKRESWIVIQLLVVGESRGRMTGPNGGGLTVELYKRTTTLARDTFGWGWVDWLNETSLSTMRRKQKRTHSRGWSRHTGGL